MSKNIEDELIELIDSYLDTPNVSLKDINNSIKMIRNENIKRQLSILLYRFLMLNVKIGSTMANSLANDESINRYISAIDEFRQELTMVAKELELDEKYLDETTALFKYYKKNDPDGAIVIDSILSAIEMKEEMLEKRVSQAVDITLSHSNGIDVYLPSYDETDPKKHNEIISKTLTSVKKDNVI